MAIFIPTLDQVWDPLFTPRFVGVFDILKIARLFRILEHLDIIRRQCLHSQFILTLRPGLDDVDDFTRECPGLAVETSLTGLRVVRELDRIAGLCIIVSDNGTDLTQMPSWHCSRNRGRASNGLTPPEFAVRPVRGIIGTGSPYKQGQLREQVKWTGLAWVESFRGSEDTLRSTFSDQPAPIFPPIVAVLPRRERAPLGFSYLSRGASAL